MQSGGRAGTSELGHQAILARVLQLSRSNSSAAAINSVPARPCMLRIVVADVSKLVAGIMGDPDLPLDWTTVTALIGQDLHGDPVTLLPPTAVGALIDAGVPFQPAAAACGHFLSRRDCRGCRRPPCTDIHGPTPFES